MVARIDLTGQRFGRLTVKEFLGSRKYLCLCDCGKEKSFFSSNLARGLSKSCGCLSVELAKTRFDGYVSTYDAAARNKEWRAENAEAIKAKKKAYREANLEKVREGQRAAYEKRREYYQQRARERYDADPSYAIMAATERKRMERQAMPAWANREAMAQIYRDARRITKETGIPHEVDHIIPIKGKDVCGLHWEGNMVIVTREENRKKWAHMPDLGEAEW
jgi:5-methylcytosine-specific restriction endonuclease McrA